MSLASRSQSPRKSLAGGSFFSCGIVNILERHSIFFHFLSFSFFLTCSFIFPSFSFMFSFCFPFFLFFFFLGCSKSSFFCGVPLGSLFFLLSVFHYFFIFVFFFNFFPCFSFFPLFFLFSFFYSFIFLVFSFFKKKFFLFHFVSLFSFLRCSKSVAALQDSLGKSAHSELASFALYWLVVTFPCGIVHILVMIKLRVVFGGRRVGQVLPSYQNRQMSALDETADAPQSGLFSLLSFLSSLILTWYLSRGG